MKRELIAKVDFITLIIAISAIFIPYLLSIFFPEQFSKRLIWPSGVIFLVIGIPYTIIYVLHRKENYAQMNPVEKMVWIKRFCFGLSLILGGLIFLL